MSDYITDMRVYYTKCPRCHHHTLKIKSWEEHLEAWGFPDYRTEYYIKRYCETCHRSISLEEIEKEREREEKHKKRTQHQKGKRRTQSRGKKRKDKRKRMKRYWHNTEIWNEDNDVPF